MEIKNMTVEQIEARKAEIVTELDKPEADLDALQEEMRNLNAELEARKVAEAKKSDIRKMVASGSGHVVVAVEPAEKVETRNTKEYIDAFAKYVKTGDDKECRALLTENVSGTLPVPEFIDGIIRTAWESDAFLSRVRRTYIRGNLRVPFELSATQAWEHTEGTTAVTEETLTLGIVQMNPKMIKKWITISDEAMAMGGETFLRYIYDEITYQVFKELKAKMIADVTGSPASSDDDEVGVAQVSMAPSVNTIAKAAAYLSDEAERPVIVLNRLSEAAFLDAYAAANFAIDPWAGLTRVYASSLPAYSSASADAVYAIVGDLNGIQANFPEGDDIVLKFDDLSLAESDLVKVVGRIYAAHDVTGPGRLVNIKKPSAVTT